MGKHFDYFNAFLAMGRHSLRAGELLKETLETYDPAVLKERMAQLHTVEHSADTLKHQLTDQLIREFLPPIEREDIMELSDVIDDLTDAIEDVVIRRYMYLSLIHIWLRIAGQSRHTRRFCHVGKDVYKSQVTMFVVMLVIMTTAAFFLSMMMLVVFTAVTMVRCV